ncbi:hypothetical protein ABIC27_000908 [Streptomyces sp. PvR034]
MGQVGRVQRGADLRGRRDGHRAGYLGGQGAVREYSTTASGEPPSSVSRAVPWRLDRHAESATTTARGLRARTASRETISPTTSSRTAVWISSPSAMANRW